MHSNVLHKFPFGHGILSPSLRAMKSLVRVAIVGANGYSGEELCAILARHPHVKIVEVTSRQHAGKPLVSVMPRFRNWPGLTDLHFVDPSAEHLKNSDAEVIFLALPHGLAKEYAQPLLESGKKIIDISADFRLRDAACYAEFYGETHPAPHLLPRAVYGLPEFRREEIARADLIASPGCYPTSMLIPLLPLLQDGVICSDDIAVSSASGVSGAGRKNDTSFLFAECNESMRAYGLPKHRHLSEVEQELSIVAGEPVTITFTPHLAPMNRGIHSTLFARLKAPAKPADVLTSWQNAYASAPFVRVLEDLPDTKHVVGTNYCDISFRYDARAKRLILLSVIDNIVKGAGGQAVQSFNIMHGFAETTGLQ